MIDSKAKKQYDHFFSLNVLLLKAGGSFGDQYPVGSPLGLVTLALLTVWSVGEWHQVVLHFKVDEEITIRGIGSIFSGYLATTKGLSLIFQDKQIREILLSLSMMWEDRYQVEQNRTVMLAEAKKAYQMTHFYFLSCMLMSAIFHLHPYKILLEQYFESKTVNNAYNFTTIMPVKYPFDINYVGNYIPVMIVEHTITVYFLIYLASSDTLFFQLLTHLCLHFKLLQYDLKYIIEQTTSTAVSDEQKCQVPVRLSKIVYRQNELYSLCKRVEKIFRPIFFASMLVTSLTICVSLHQIQQVDQQYIKIKDCVLMQVFSLIHINLNQRKFTDFVYNIDWFFQVMFAVGQFFETLGPLSHGVVLLSEVAIYCGCSTILSHETAEITPVFNFHNKTELVAIAAYNCPWLCFGKEICNQLKYLMLRSQRAFCFTAYGFFRVDLPQLTTIVSAAATYFTLLNTLVKQK
ncbi:uncharacterized protein LOC124409121 [Diprion similis]|uniref:uncharacterized protein LOC124409121 n=1 Tax=Diprion similis TaxID=362088 RepID=UPI001EF816A7|nr:uncharacterized protein LOC124409121 [Diprion similis]